MSPAEVPDALVQAAAYAIFAEEQCDKRQARDVPYQWNTRLNEADHEEYRALARAALAAVLPEIQAQALVQAALDLDLPGSTATGYYASEQVAGYNDADRDAEAWLTKRAAQLRATTTEEPTT